MMEELFVLNLRGDVLVSKRYFSGSSDSELYEAAFRALMSPQAVEPELYLGLHDRYIAHISKGGVIACAVTAPSMLGLHSRLERLGLLSQVVAVLEELAGSPSNAASSSVSVDEGFILSNRFLVAELLEGVIFAGYPVTLSVAALKAECILSRAANLKPSPPFEVFAEAALTITNAISTGAGVPPRAPRVCVAVTDDIFASYSASRCLVSSCLGSVAFASTDLMAQDVEVALTLPDMASRPAVPVFDTCLFDGSVSAGYFDVHRRLKFRCVEQRLRLMTFTLLLAELVLPLHITTSLKQRREVDYRGFDLHVIVKATSMPSFLHASNLLVRIPLPSTTVDATTPFGATEGFEYVPGECIVHRIRGVYVGSDLHLRYRIRLEHSVYHVSDIGPVEASYEVNGHSASNVRVANIALSSENACAHSWDGADKRMAQREITYCTRVNAEYRF